MSTTRLNHVDTRSDIYSLGVVLYELLTGVTPFDRETLAQIGLDEIRRMIRENEPPKPSTRLQTLGEKLTDVAKHRHTEPATLSRFVRGDMDWIVMKCLEKDRQRRYETANGLAMDVKRFQNDEPVTAAAPTLSYRWLKFATRHRAPLTVAAGIALVLVTATTISTSEAVRATRAKQREKAQAPSSQQVAKFLETMLEGVQPSVALGRDRTLLLEILNRLSRMRSPLQSGNNSLSK